MGCRRLRSEKNDVKKKEVGFLTVYLRVRRPFPAPQPELEGFPELPLFALLSTSMFRLPEDML